MLVGEPGIGKTRTAQELSVLADQRGAQVLPRNKSAGPWQMCIGLANRAAIYIFWGVFWTIHVFRLRKPWQPT